MHAQLFTSHAHTRSASQSTSPPPRLKTQQCPRHLPKTAFKNRRKADGFGATCPLLHTPKRRRWPEVACSTGRARRESDGVGALSAPATGKLNGDAGRAGRSDVGRGGDHAISSAGAGAAHIAEPDIVWRELRRGGDHSTSSGAGRASTLLSMGFGATVRFARIARLVVALCVVATIACEVSMHTVTRSGWVWVSLACQCVR